MYLLKGPAPKNKGHTYFEERCDFDEKVHLTYTFEKNEAIFLYVNLN